MAGQPDESAASAAQILCFLELIRRLPEPEGHLLATPLSAGRRRSPTLFPLWAHTAGRKPSEEAN